MAGRPREHHPSCLADGRTEGESVFEAQNGQQGFTEWGEAAPGDSASAVSTCAGCPRRLWTRTCSGGPAARAGGVGQRQATGEQSAAGLRFTVCFPMKLFRCEQGVAESGSPPRCRGSLVSSGPCTGAWGVCRAQALTCAVGELDGKKCFCFSSHRDPLRTDHYLGRADL